MMVNRHETPWFYFLNILELSRPTRPGLNYSGNVNRDKNVVFDYDYILNDVSID